MNNLPHATGHAIARHCRPRLATRSGLARGEVVVLVGVAVLLAGMLFPYWQQRRAAARRNTCESRLQQLVLAAQACNERHGHWPGYVHLQAQRPSGERVPASWVFPLLPFLGKEADPRKVATYAPLYEEFGPAAPEATRGQSWARFLPEIVCPDRAPARPLAEPLWLSFVANTGLPDEEPEPGALPDWPANGALVDLFRTEPELAEPPSLATFNQGDGADRTLLFSENVDAGYAHNGTESLVGFVWRPYQQQGLPQPGPELCRVNQERGQGNGSLRFARPSSYHGPGVNAAYAGGKTWFMNERIDYLVYCQLMTSDGSQVKQAGSTADIGPPFRTEPRAEVE